MDSFCGSGEFFLRERERASLIIGVDNTDVLSWRTI